MNKINLLQSVPLFSDLSDSSLSKISQEMILRSYTKEQMILVEDNPGETFFIVAQGSVKVTRTSEDGREVILTMLGAGDFFGEMSLLDGKTRSANVVALEATETLTLSRRDFLSILETYPKIAIHLLEELTTRIRWSDRQIESLSLSGAEKRIAIALIRLAEELGTIRQGAVTVQNLPYQQDIANMAGTSRETVSRVLKLLEEQNYIQRHGRTLVINQFVEFSRMFA
ncbi:MAG: Crp/Fnr family transcriptional regulator [Candidatus Marinimicrobia bacterium]|nr:Crp/Fnr family transcriptional regulator [Candidatus Neomarinimicrobiota bacterium]